MSLFAYSARASDGRASAGEIEAQSAASAAALLASRGLTPIKIKASSNAGESLWPKLWEPRVSRDELIMFCRQMYTLTHAGVPMSRALAGLQDTARDPQLADALGQVGDSLRSGKGLADSFEAHPRVFSTLFVNTIHMGENSGRLEESFQDLATYIERESETIKRIKSASRYPMGVIGAVAIAITIINLFVIPAFSDVFGKLGHELPLPTRLLMWTSDLFVNYWAHMLVSLICGIAGLRYWLSTERGHYLWSKYQLRIPVVGSVIERATLARFARGFVITAASGVPIIAALKNVAAAVDNDWVSEKIMGIREGISRGESLTNAAQASGLFLPLVLQMISVGEETGSVEPLLAEVAEFYEREVDYDLKRLSDAIEPLLIILMGAIVLILALGVYLPLWDLSKVMN